MDGLSDPSGSNAVVAALAWLEGTLLGTVATTVAIIAVASVGYAMLTGRIDWLRAARIFIGCFILLGAPSIVAGLRTTVATEPVAVYEQPAYPAPRQDFSPILVPDPPPPARPANPDPYAGAAVPSR